ncbi:MAG: hypothetical protein JWQ40_2544 [Segetibacter sp.]|nr:hypothetical protein [Segetibacter sp.]
MTQKERISEVLVIVGIAAFAWYRYSKLTEAQKISIQSDIKEIGGKIMKEFIPEQIKGFLPANLK